MTRAVFPLSLSIPGLRLSCFARKVGRRNRRDERDPNCLGTPDPRPPQHVPARRRVQIALRLRAFGGPENFELTDVPKQAIRPGMALIRVDATSVNQIDVRIRSGQVPIGPDLGLSLS